MMTIGRTHRGPARDYQTACDVCGVNWLRSEMTATEDGLLLCPDDREGMRAIDLNRERAEAAGAPSGPTPARRR